MLLLTRRRDESIIIELPDGRTISVMAAKCFGDRVQLGIDAPRDIPVHRLEIYEAIQREKERGESHE